MPARPRTDDRFARRFARSIGRRPLYRPAEGPRRGAIVPRGRVGYPKDIADAVAFLASPRADYVNGEDVTVDGGFSAVLMAQVPRPGFDAPGR
jgi:NAD(P)-dependent dehydrogenase (short-subunit alcohol dehydrogenase family)